MAYHEISIMDIWEVIRRWHSGQGIRKIARSLVKGHLIPPVGPKVFPYLLQC